MHDHECVELISLFKHKNEGSRRQMAAATKPHTQSIYWLSNHTVITTTVMIIMVIIKIIIKNILGHFN